MGRLRTALRGPGQRPGHSEAVRLSGGRRGDDAVHDRTLASPKRPADRITSGASGNGARRVIDSGRVEVLRNADRTIRYLAPGEHRRLYNVWRVTMGTIAPVDSFYVAFFRDDRFLVVPYAYDEPAEYAPPGFQMLHAILAAPCLTTFCRLDELGPEAVGQRLEPDQAVIERRHPAAFTD